MIDGLNAALLCLIAGELLILCFNLSKLRVELTERHEKKADKGQSKLNIRAVKFWFYLKQLQIINGSWHNYTL